MALAVGVHRFVLLGEAPPGFKFFRWSREFVQYVLTALALVLAAGLVSLTAAASVRAMTAAGTDGGIGVATPLMLAGIAIVAVALCRLSLALPSAALGDQIPIRLIWYDTRRNGVRMFAATLLSALPFLAVDTWLFQLSPATQSPSEAGLAGVLVTIALGLISPLQLIVVTIMLALQYDALVRGGGPAGSSPI